MKSHMWGPHQSPFYFCMNQFREFHYSELQNLILAYFKTFKKNEKDVEKNCRRENDNLFYGEWDFGT